MTSYYPTKTHDELREQNSPVVHPEAEECWLPIIPEGMVPDETWGQQCSDCPHGIETPYGVYCDLEVNG